MRIDNTQNVNNLLKENISKNNLEINKLVLPQKGKVEPSVVYQKTILGDKAEVYDLISLKKLGSESKDVVGQLENMVEEMLTDQGKALDVLSGKAGLDSGGFKESLEKAIVVDGEIVNIDGIKIDEEALLAQAKELVSPGGRLGVEAASEEVVDFVKTASDGEKGKVDVLIDVLDKGFEDGEALLGDLPELSKNTYDSIMEKINSFIGIEKPRDETANAEVKPELEVELKEMLEAMIAKQSSVTAELSKGGTHEEELIKSIIDRDTTGKSELIKGASVESALVETDEDILALAKNLIGQRGQVDIEDMSEDILSFIKAASEGDPKKLDALKSVIDRTFNDAKQNLGLLPEVSKMTYDRIIQELAYWEEELEKRKYPGWPIFGATLNMYRRIQEYSRFGIRTYLTIILGAVILYYGIRYLF